EQYKTKHEVFGFIVEREYFRGEASKIRISENNTKQNTKFLFFSPMRILFLTDENLISHQ
ncbi:MAG: hypothetical protein II429_00130, partial [Prevotella sp.]|nr:hypothetical protein [Prevotella sp.]